MKNLFILLFLGLTINSFSQENIDLFIWAGQSNALGRQGDAAGYPVDANNQDAQIRFNWKVPNIGNSGGWTTMQPQALGGYFTAGHFGPEVTFSRKLEEAGYNPAIFKFTQGATSIFQHWNGPGEAGLYDVMVADLNTAITTLENQGHTVTVRGLIWIQGESDSNSQAAATAYLASLTSILNDLRNNVVNNSNLPIILGVDEQFFNLTNHEQQEILNAHEDLALNDANIKFTSMYGYPKADVTHLTPAGLITHGEDLFDSFELLVSGQTPLNSCTLTSNGAIESYLRASWGQSFTTDCSGLLSTVTFSAASQHVDNATFTIHNGADCSGTVLFTQTLSSIEVGDNVVTVNNGLYLDKEHTYYLNIVSNTSTFWKINYSNTDNVYGMLRTFLNGSDCGRSFPSFDMDFSVVLAAVSPCALSSNVHAFTYSGNNYEVIKENKSWVNAAACAVERGGFLVEINNQAEQDAVFNELQNNAAITVSNTVAPDGGGASYAWIGANDLASEGVWVWNGDNDASSTQYWQGGPAAFGGVPVGGLYNNWGSEPDNSGNNQDAAAIGLTQWPVNSGSLGSAGQWNDVDHTNGLYSVIEYPCVNTTSIINASSCGSYTSPSGKVWNTSNTYQDTITNFSGCDSILTINLTVNTPDATTDIQTACESYVWIDGVTYTLDNNTATFLLQNNAGCDSLVTLDLTIEKETVVLTESGGVLTTNAGASNYQWYLNGILITAANNQTYQPTESGNYTVEVSWSLGCSELSPVFTYNAVSVSEILDLELTIAPNPSQGIFNVYSLERISIVVLDLQGKIIYSNSNINNYFKLDLSNVENGVYVLNLETDKGKKITKKLVKN